MVATVLMKIDVITSNKCQWIDMFPELIKFLIILPCYRGYYIFNHDYLECKLLGVKHNSVLKTKVSNKKKISIIITQSFLENRDAWFNSHKF